MSRFGQFFRATTAATLTAVSVAPIQAQQPAANAAPLPDVSEYLKQNPVSPASFGRGATAPGCPPAPCAPCAPVPGGPCPPGVTFPGAPSTGMPPAGQPVIDPNAFGSGTTAANLGGFEGGAGMPTTIGMWGNYFGGRPSQTLVLLTTPGALNGYSIVATANGLRPIGTGLREGNLGSSVLSIRDPRGYTPPGSPRIPFRSIGISGQFTETFPTPTINPPVITGLLQYLAGAPGATIPAGLNANPQTLATLRQLGILPAIVHAPDQAANPNAKLGPVSFDPATGVYLDSSGTAIDYVSRINSYLYNSPPVMISVPNPGMGGVVGLITIAEDNNPLPRDRFIFNYDYFDNVPLTPNGIPVNRYQFGVEKTFFDGWTSLEVRVPFASTLNSTVGVLSDGTNTEFGNIRLAAKALLVRRSAINISTGVAVYLPTADDFNMNAGNGTNLVHVANRSVQLSPYLAALYTPTDRFFAQAWLGFVFDTNRNTVTVNPDYFAGATNIGTLRAPSLMMADLQVGYWVYQANSGILQGLAPFCEVHYNGAIGNGSVLSTPNGLLIGDATGNFDEWNISAGFLAQLGQNTSLSVGAAAPLRSGQNRTFDYQIGVRLNYFFGYTARQRSATTQIGGF